jgi:hypothetical protein
MGDFQLKTPVAFLIFNRPNTTEKVFEAIRQAKPPKLLVVADGPRQDRPEDVEKCKAARAIIEGVDWDCEVLTNYSDINLGCKNRVSSGLNWVFDTVEEAIILEDDCVADPTFFQFCEELLNYYRFDQRIMVISGNNFQFGKKRTDYSYYFSRYNHCWGWATWRRAWRYYDGTMKNWPEVRDSTWLTAILENSQTIKYWTKVFQSTYDNKNDTWDYRWTFSCWIQNGLTILPNHNLVSNIGFDQGATHTQTKNSRLANIPVQEMIFPLRHPPFMLRDVFSDKFTHNIVFKANLFSLPRRIIAKASKLVS